ncbi:MAG: hypothetical protein CVT92_04580 [Bacteroidetes bacterium HGW-Bacteroidetes-1]|jgi:two-component system LytT family response regulator|nr:MAG: hypothetical protein CVT92_04580 [Bacteroidetes bacterium HGW-Bacteroidetes-1]
MAKELTALIVDDDLLSRKKISAILNEFSELDILASLSDVDCSIRVIAIKAPDVIFVNLDMPGKDGFDLIDELHALEIKTNIVFMAELDHYAKKAIRYDVMDYLIKPINKYDVDNIIKRLLSNKYNHNIPKKIDLLINQLNRQKRTRFNTRCGFILVDPNDIVYIQADWNYSEIFLNNGLKEILSMNLGSVMNVLPDRLFARITRSHIINVNYLTKVDRKSRICSLKFNDQLIQIQVPARRVKALEDFLD